MKNTIKITTGLILALLVGNVFKAQGQKQADQVVEFSVSLHCENCVKKVESNIPYEKGVKELSVNLEQKKVTITFQPAKTSADKLRVALEKLGYTVEPWSENELKEEHNEHQHN